MTSKSYGAILGNTWAGTFVQAVDAAAASDRLSQAAPSTAPQHRKPRRPRARVAPMGLLIALGTAGATLIAAMVA